MLGGCHNNMKKEAITKKNSSQETPQSKKTLWVMFSLVGIFMILLISAVSFEPSNMLEWYNGSLGTSQGATGIAQSFTIGTVGANHDSILKGVSFKGYALTSSIFCNYTLYSDAFVTRIANKSTDCSEWATTWFNVSFPFTTLTASTQYWISIVGDGSAMNLDSPSGNAYAGGTNYYSVNNGGSWVQQTGQDIGFIIYNGTITNLTFLIEVNLKTPLNLSSLSTNYTELNANFTCSVCNLTNATFYVWNSSDFLYNKSSTFVINGTTNNTLWNATGLNMDNYKWNVYACGVNASSYTLCNWSSTGNFSFSIGASIINETYSNSVFETAQESFTINITSLGGNTPTNAYLVYNGTDYPAVISNIAGQNYTISRTIDIPTISGDKTFHWKWNLGNFLQTTSDSTQQVNQSILTICNTTYQTPFINFTFKDESTDTIMTSKLDSSIWTYWLGSGSVNKTLIFSNTTTNPSYAFCFSPNKTLITDLSFKYSNTSYPQRTFTKSNWYLTNSTTNQILYLLSSSDGQYVSFQIINTAEQPISGTTVNITRIIGSATVIIGSGTTDSSGVITFWLNPDYPHVLTVYKTSYALYTATITPSSTQYTITLGGTTTIITDYGQGVSYSVSPSAGTFLDENTLYNFSLSLTSSYWIVTNFGFSLYYENDTLIGSNSSASNGGLITLSNINTTNQSSIYMNYYYTINNTNMTFNPSFWTIQSIEGREFSIWHFFEDLDLYLDSGLFGIDDFGRLILTFVLIIMVVGGISMRYGIRNDAFIMGILFGLVLLFDVGLGFIPPINIGNLTVPSYFLTMIIGIILLGFLIKEESR